MSSLARRSLRTTAAAAGIAALGVGLAGHAFAAPELPALPGADSLPGTDSLPAAPESPAAPALPEAPSADGMSVPGLMNIEMPAVNTAAPELPAGDAFAVPTAPEFAAPEFAAPEFGTPAAPTAPEMGAPEAPALPGGPEAPGTDGVANVEFDGVQGPSAEDFTEGQNNVGAMQAMDMAAFLMEMGQTASEGGSVTENQQIG
jgi:hypothetical protein